MLPLHFYEFIRSGARQPNNSRMQKAGEFFKQYMNNFVISHKSSVVGEHMVQQHGEDAKNIEKNFKVLRKCRGKFECLLYEMLFIKDLKPSLNKQSDSIRSKLFT